MSVLKFLVQKRISIEESYLKYWTCSICFNSKAVSKNNLSAIFGSWKIQVIETDFFKIMTFNDICCKDLCFFAVLRYERNWTQMLWSLANELPLPLLW